MGIVYEWARRLALSKRHKEFRQAMKFLAGAERILDVGCGKGGFMDVAPDRIEGIDFNPNNVKVCQAKEQKVTLGDALDMPFEDNSFDGVYCGHVMHVFLPAQAKQIMSEMIRVLRPGGILVITTVKFHKRLWHDPGDVRPYPPQAIRAMTRPPSFGSDEVSAPTISGVPPMYDDGIWFRRPPLIHLNGARSFSLSRVVAFLNVLQHVLYLQKYWTYDAYMIKLRKPRV